MITFQLDNDVSLRQWKLSDAPAVFGVVSRNYDHLSTFMEWLHPDHSIVDYRAFVEREVASAAANTGLAFGIFRNEQLIGAVGFGPFDREARVAEVGYWIDREEEGKGIVSRSVAKLIDHAFSELGMNRIQIRCATANTRSSAIPQRFGFKLEGVQRQHVSRNGILYDYAIYGLLASEWDGQKNGL
jgi:ribosomal-protein-serine acetyltransferase